MITIAKNEDYNITRQIEIDIMLIMLTGSNTFKTSVVRKALLVKAPPRGVCRRLSIVLNFDHAPDLRSCRSFRLCSYGSCDSSVSLELMKVKNNI